MGGFRFNDNQNYLYDRDIVHKRSSQEVENSEDAEHNLPSNWEEWGDFGDFTGLMEDVSLYPSSLGLFDRTILTRVQKRDKEEEQEEQSVEKREETSNTKENRGGSQSEKGKNGSVSTSLIKPGLKMSLPNHFLFNR